MGQIPNAEEDLRRETARLIIEHTNITERATCAGRDVTAEEIVLRTHAWDFSVLSAVAHWCQRTPGQRESPPQQLVDLLNWVGNAVAVAGQWEKRKVMRFKVDDLVVTQLNELARITKVTESNMRPYTYELQNGKGTTFDSDGSNLKLAPPGGEQVNHPQHYGGDTPYEAIKVMLAWYGPERTRWFCVLSAVKYVSRMGKKPGEPLLRDLKKAIWYLEYAAKLSDEIEAEKK